jgi:putative transposase
VTDVNRTAGTPAEEDALDAVDEQLIRQLADRARAEGLRLTGEGGLLVRLTKTVLESALEGELDDHLGYAKHEPAGRNGENSRNGRRGKTVLTEVGPVPIAVPRDRDVCSVLRHRSPPPNEETPMSNAAVGEARRRAARGRPRRRRGVG